jgi:hypothetical protein
LLNDDLYTPFYVITSIERSSTLIMIIQTHFRTIVFVGSVAKHKAALLLDVESGSLV